MVHRFISNALAFALLFSLFVFNAFADAVPSLNLVGLSWDTSLQEELFSSWNPSMSFASVTNVIEPLDTVKSSASALDIQNNHLYQVGNEDGADDYYLYMINFTTGNLNGQLLLDRGYSTLDINARQEMIGLSWNSELQQQELFKLDTATGQSALIASYASMSTITSSASAINNLKNRLYQIGYTEGDSSPRLFTINSLTGELIGNQVIDRSYANLVVNRKGELIGLSWNSMIGEEELLKLNPTTGISTVIATIEPLDSVTSAAHAYDKLNNYFYQVGYTNGDTAPRLFTIDASAGVVVKNQESIYPYSVLQVTYQ